VLKKCRNDKCGSQKLEEHVRRLTTATNKHPVATYRSAKRNPALHTAQMRCEDERECGGGKTLCSCSMIPIRYEGDTSVILR
jgi:hypothetical protein